MHGMLGRYYAYRASVAALPLKFQSGVDGHCQLFSLVISDFSIRLLERDVGRLYRGTMRRISREP